MIKDFLKGLTDAKKGWTYLWNNFGLLRFLIIPTIINLGLFVLLVWLMYYYYNPLFDSITNQLGGLTIEKSAWWTHLVYGLLWMIRGILHFILGVVLVVFFVVIMIFVSQIINGPFYDLLSQAVEKKVVGSEDQSFHFKKFIRDLGKTFVLEIKKLLFFLNVPLFLLVLNFIPVVGSIFYTILANTFAAWDMGFNFISYPMGRKVIPFMSQIRFGLKYKARFIGFGLPLLIPFFNLILAPIFVIGGTLLWIELKGPGFDSNKRLIL